MSVSCVSRECDVCVMSLRYLVGVRLVPHEREVSVLYETSCERMYGSVSSQPEGHSRWSS